MLLIYMKIAMGADHAGFDLKESIKKELESLGYEILDCGTASGDLKVDYPDWGFKTAESVASHKAEMGILFCGTGIGMSIVANKVNGIRASLCHDHFTAEMSRKHNNANVLVIGSRSTSRPWIASRAWAISGKRCTSSFSRAPSNPAL